MRRWNSTEGYVSRGLVDGTMGWKEIGGASFFL